MSGPLMLNETHDASLTSWVESANRPGGDFPLQNLPFGVFRRRDRDESFRGGVAIGEQILDLRAAHALGVFEGLAGTAAAAAVGSSLNALMALGTPAWSALRLRLSQLLRAGAVEAPQLRACLVEQAAAEYCVPANIGDYTDFLSSYHHMLNMANIFAPGAPIPANFMWQPLAYHGRVSSIEISGASFERPRGQTRPPDAEQPLFGPSRRLDYELELGFFVGPGTARGSAVPIDRAEAHIFGLCLLNDWSARDVQAWEANPLGPFLAKNFITTVSPWIVTLEALAPYRCTAARPADGPATLPHLQATGSAESGSFDIALEAGIRTAASGAVEMRLSRSNFRHAHWTTAQMLTHHAEGGCNLRSGDLMGTGTQSGPTPGEEGCLMEMTAGGRVPVQLANGEVRTFLEDGDSIVMRAWCERDGYVRIGFGECSGTVLPARP